MVVKRRLSVFRILAWTEEVLTSTLNTFSLLDRE